MNQSIDKIVLDHFRGASCKTEILLDTKKPVVMFFGENGTGKSTIVDAIDLIANESKGSIGERSSTKPKDLSTIGCKASDISVELISGSESWKGCLSGTKITVQGQSPRPKVHILRRSKLLSLIEAQPSKRYEELRTFIDVEGIEKSEKALRDSFNTVKQEFNNSIKSLQDSKDALEKLWKDEGSNGQSYVVWAKEKTNSEPKELREKKNELDKINKSIENIRSKKSNLGTYETNFKTADSNLKEIMNEINSAPSLNAAELINLIDILDKTQNYINTSDLSVCPVCEQSIEINALRTQISNRLKEMKIYKDLSEKQKKSQNLLNSAQTIFTKAQNELIEAIESFVNSNKNSNIKSIKTLDLQSLPENGNKYTTALDIANQLLLLQQTIADEIGNIQSDINQFNAIKGHLDRIETEKENSKHLEELSKRLSKSLEITQSERIKFTQSILDGVSEESNALYRKIHPNESLGGLKLALDENKKGSLSQEATFEGHNQISPQAYYSESHLDTYGFCVWLAIAKRERPKDTIVILDDVFTSVDSTHLTRIVDLITEECKNFAQVIITTHYRNWRDRYRHAQGPGNEVQLIELHRWSINRGIKLSKSKLAIEELEEKLKDFENPLDRQAISSQAGIFLEALLDEIALLYRCRLPRSHEGNYTLGELQDGVKKVFGKINIEKLLDSENGSKIFNPNEFFDDLCKMTFIRNQVGCHFNLTGFEVSDSDVETFGNKTVELARSMTCDNCGEIARRRKGDHFTCSCGKMKMKPLEFK